MNASRAEDRRDARSGPVCRIIIDTRRLPSVPNADALAALLRAAPGVVQVQVDARRQRCIVLHDSRTSLAWLWNWLLQHTSAPTVGAPSGTSTTPARHGTDPSAMPHHTGPASGGTP